MDSFWSTPRLQWKTRNMILRLSYLLFLSLLSSLLLACTTNASSPQTSTQKTPATQNSTHQEGVLYLGYMLYQKPYNPNANPEPLSATIIVAALNADTGQKIWQNAFPAQYLAQYAYTTSVVVANTIVYAVISAGVSGQVIALDVRTGHILWKYTEHTGGIFEPIAANGDLYIQVGTERASTLQTLESKSGKLLWKASIVGYGIDEFTVTDQAVYLDAQGLNPSSPSSVIVRALRSGNGATLWQKEFHNQPPDQSGMTQLLSIKVQADEQAVYLFKMEMRQEYVPAYKIDSLNTLIALDPEDGSLLWNVQDPHNYLEGGSTGFLLDEHVLYLMNGVHMNMFNAQDGKLLSMYTSPFYLWILLPAGHLYGTTGHAKTEHFCALKSSDGTSFWCLPFGIDMVAPGNDHVYLINNDAVSQQAIYVVQQSTGEQLEHYTVDDPARVVLQSMVFAEENL